MIPLVLVLVAAAAQQPPPALPSSPMTFGAFTATFDGNGTFSLTGQG